MRASTTAAERKFVKGAADHGRELAAKVIKAREAKKRKGIVEAKGPSNGLLIAEGDSWFDYPFFDTLERLEHSFNFEIESVAHKGDTVEAMAYDANQTAAWALVRQAGSAGTAGRAPSSGGGNDIGGGRVRDHAEPRGSGRRPERQGRGGRIDVRLKAALVSVISGVTLSRHYFQRAVPILIHGYTRSPTAAAIWAAPVLPGPGSSRLHQKGTRTGHQRRSDGGPDRPLQRHGADARPSWLRARDSSTRKILDSDLSVYKKTWNDELHPTKPGFGAVVAEFARSS